RRTTEWTPSHATSRSEKTELGQLAYGVGQDVDANAELGHGRRGLVDVHVRDAGVAERQGQRHPADPSPDDGDPHGDVFGRSSSKRARAASRSSSSNSSPPTNRSPWNSARVTGKNSNAPPSGSVPNVWPTASAPWSVVARWYMV